MKAESRTDFDASAGIYSCKIQINNTETILYMLNGQQISCQMKRQLGNL